MKTRPVMFLVSLLLLAGCDLVKDLGEVTFSTDLTMNIPVVVAPAKSAVVALPEAGINFSASKDLVLEDNEDIQPYLDKLRKINLKSLVVTVTGLSGDQTINSLTLGVTGVGTICTQSNITATNNSFTPVIDAAKLVQAGEKLKIERKITVTVSGEASAPMSFVVGLNFDTDITAGALD